MANMKHIQVVRGIPRPREVSAERSAKGFGNGYRPRQRRNIRTPAVGLTDHEFIAMTLVSPIEYEALKTGSPRQARGRHTGIPSCRERPV